VKMKARIYTSKMSNLFFENKSLKLTLAALIIITFLNYIKLESALNNQSTVLVPVGFDSKIEISSNQASEEYLLSMVEAVQSLALNYSPGNAKYKFEQLLKMYDDRYFGEAQFQLNKVLETVKNTSNSSVFQIKPDKTKISTNNKLYFTGNREIRYIGKNKDPEQVEEIYVLAYTIKHSTFKIKQFYKMGEDEKY
jgi:type IV conjugative transfer system protein TraE